MCNSNSKKIIFEPKLFTGIRIRDIFLTSFIPLGIFCAFLAFFELEQKDKLVFFIVVSLYSPFFYVIFLLFRNIWNYYSFKKQYFLYKTMIESLPTSTKETNYPIFEGIDFKKRKLFSKKFFFYLIFAIVVNLILFKFIHKKEMVIVIVLSIFYPVLFYLFIIFSRAFLLYRSCIQSLEIYRAELDLYYNKETGLTLINTLKEGCLLDVIALKDRNEQTYLVVLYFVIILFSFLIFAFLIKFWYVFFPPLFSYFFFYYWSQGNSIEVTKKQYKEIYDCVSEACKYLDIENIPKIYVHNGDGLLYMTLDKIFIRRGVIRLSLIGLRELISSGDSRQIMMIIGTQLAHIKMKHYRKWFIKDYLGLMVFPIQRAYRRKCTYTADKIGALICGDIDAAQKGLITYTVGSALSIKTNVASIYRQAKQNNQSLMSHFLNLFMDKPYLINRIVELDKLRRIVAFDAENTDKQNLLGFFPRKANSFNITVNGTAYIGDMVNVNYR